MRKVLPEYRDEANTLVTNCLDHFQKNSVIALYFLTGDYLNRSKWSTFAEQEVPEFLSKPESEQRIEEMFRDIQERSKQQTHSLRKLLLGVTKHTDQIEFPGNTGLPFLPLYDQLRIQVSRY